MAWGDGAWSEGQPGANWTLLDGRARWRVGPRRWQRPEGGQTDNPFIAPTQPMPPVQPMDDAKAAVTTDQPVQSSPSPDGGGGFDLGKYLTLGQGGQPGIMTPGQAGLLAFGASLLANKRKRGAAIPAVFEGMQASQAAVQQGERAKQQALESARQAKLDARTDSRYAAEQAQAQARQAALAKLSPEEQQQAALMGDDYWKQRAESLFKEVKPPTSRTINIGGEEVSQEWDPSAKAWKEIGRGSRWQPQQSITPYQQAQLDLDRQKFDWQKGHPGGGAGEPMVEVYDPNSPTGTSYLPRSQAAGKPGKPGTEGIEVTQPDGTTFRVGGKSTGDGKAPAGYRFKADGSLEPIPGGPAEKANESAAGKLALLPGALDDLKSVQGALFDENGDPNRTAIASMNMPLPGILGGGQAVPGTQGVGLRAKMRAAVDTMIRLRTGAAATAQEVEDQLGAYMPNATDPANVAQEKMARFKRDLENAQSELSRGSGGPRNYPTATEDRADRAGTPAQQAAPAQPAPVQIKGDAEYEALPSGALFVGPDGKQRRKP